MIKRNKANKGSLISKEIKNRRSFSKNLKKVKSSKRRSYTSTEKSPTKNLSNRNSQPYKKGQAKFLYKQLIENTNDKKSRSKSDPSNTQKQCHKKTKRLIQKLPKKVNKDVLSNLGIRLDPSVAQILSKIVAKNIANKTPLTFKNIQQLAAYLQMPGSKERQEFLIQAIQYYKLTNPKDILRTQYLTKEAFQKTKEYSPNGGASIEIFRDEMQEAMLSQQSNSTGLLRKIFDYAYQNKANLIIRSLIKAGRIIAAKNSISQQSQEPTKAKPKYSLKPTQSHDAYIQNLNNQKGTLKPIT